MKKFVFYFICYIGCLLSIFNTAFAENGISQENSVKPLIYIHVDDTPTPATDEENVIENTQKAENITTPQPKKRTDKLKNLTVEIYKLILTPFIIDKLYPEGEINKNITGALAQLYPTATATQLKYMSLYTKTFLSVKRRYDYVVNRLEQQIKAAKLLPEDAPIVAQDGEFAPEFPEDRKQSAPDEYNVKYQPYKYIGYDSGELGEPVRRRDKNYQEKITNIDEITLAILKFDIPAFVKAVNKLPRSTDNSAEKPVKLASGVEARLLMAQSAPGDNPKLQAVIEVYIPEGHYITADFLNPRTRPHFFLSEDKAANENISGYELFLPEANGVVKDGVAKRILTRTVRYPIEFTRKDIDKPTTIKGKFAFELCDKAGNCTPEITEHEFTIRPSLDEELSIYYNYVTQGFTHLPPEKSKHAELKEAVYDAENKTLSLTFSATKTMSQVAVMAEDANGTNFLNPRYRIEDNEITATFDVLPPALPSPPEGEGQGEGGAYTPHSFLPLEGGAYTPHRFLPLEGGGVGGGEIIKRTLTKQEGVSGSDTIHQIAVTAMFNNRENLRTVTTPEAPSRSIRPSPLPLEEEASRFTRPSPLGGGGQVRGTTINPLPSPHSPRVAVHPLNQPQPSSLPVPLALLPLEGGGVGGGENKKATISPPHLSYPSMGRGTLKASPPSLLAPLSLPSPSEGEGEGQGEGDNNKSLFPHSLLVKNHTLSTPQPSSLPVRLAPPLVQYFAYGLLLNLMPAIFYLFIRLIALFWSRKERARIFLRYILGATLGWAILVYCFAGHYWSKIYETPLFTALSLTIVVSFLSECMDYMDFALFRPLRGKLRRGFLIGLFSPLLITAFPMIMSPEILSTLFALPADMAIGKYAAILAGMFTLPLIAFLFPQDKPLFFKAMRALNVVYNFIYLAGALWLIGILRGEVAFWLTLLCLALIWGLWYIYPIAITETISHTKAPAKQKILFHKVQRHAFIVLIILAGLTYAAVATFPIPPEKTDIPTPVAVIQQFKNDTSPVLVAVTAPWSLTGTINSPYLKKLESEGVKTIEIRAIEEATAATPWFSVYDKRHAPLNVLFTARHPYGLVLPNDLTQINWQEALAVFTKTTPATQTPAERTKEND